MQHLMCVERNKMESNAENSALQMTGLLGSNGKIESFLYSVFLSEYSINKTIYFELIFKEKQFNDEIKSNFAETETFPLSTGEISFQHAC